MTCVRRDLRREGQGLKLMPQPLSCGGGGGVGGHKNKMRFEYRVHDCLIAGIS